MNSSIVGEQRRRQPCVIVRVEVATHDDIVGFEGSKQRGEIWMTLTRTAVDGRKINVDYG